MKFINGYDGNQSGAWEVGTLIIDIKDGEFIDFVAKKRRLWRRFFAMRRTFGH